MQRISVALILVVLLAACAPAAQQSPTVQPTTVPPTSGAAEAAPAAAAQRPAWHNLTLTNARTGETFTLADFAGKVVSVEPMATWCTNCRRQQTTLSAIVPQYSDDVVFISLSVGENVSNETLAAYADSAGFGWVFAVATPELLTALVEQFGRTVTAPPSTPHFYIAPDGTTTTLDTGFKSADEFVTRLNGLRGV
jgi:thiol-disulfide isomerase/thioredoxin